MSRKAVIGAVSHSHFEGRFVRLDEHLLRIGRVARQLARAHEGCVALHINYVISFDSTCPHSRLKNILTVQLRSNSCQTFLKRI